MTRPVRATALPILSAAAARAADAAAVAAGDTYDVLMGRAAGHLANTVLEVAGRAAGLRVDIVVGRGDNGGDGWAAAPLLAARGAAVRVVAPDGIDATTSDASARARAGWMASGGRVCTGDVAPHLVADDGVAYADVVVDCLLGTGSDGPLRGSIIEAAAAVHAARAGGAAVVACDVPSGVSADDGSVAEGAVAADATVTLGALKRGLLLAPGSAHTGRIAVGRLGPRFVGAAESAWSMLTAAGARPGTADAHTEKRSRGVVLVVAGRVGASGAAVLAGRGALAAGAGLVTVAVPGPVRAEVAAAHPALMVVELPADADGAVHADAVHALPLDGVDAVVAGPGMGVGAGAAAVVDHLRRTCPWLVLDADALNVHRDEPDRLADHAASDGGLVLTPHARELERIAGAGAYARRAERVPELAARLGATVVAKGPGTLVAGPAGAVQVIAFDEPALATAGTGDVLAGMLGAALAGLAAGGTAGGAAGGTAGGTAVLHHVARAVWWHAAAGRAAGARSGGRTDATGVLDALPGVLAALRLDTPRDGRGPRDPGLRDPGPSGRVWLDRLLDAELPVSESRPIGVDTGAGR